MAQNRSDMKIFNVSQVGKDTVPGLGTEETPHNKRKHLRFIASVIIIASLFSQLHETITVLANPAKSPVDSITSYELADPIYQPVPYSGKEKFEFCLMVQDLAHLMLRYNNNIYTATRRLMPSLQSDTILAPELRTDLNFIIQSIDGLLKWLKQEKNVSYDLFQEETDPTLSANQKRYIELMTTYIYRKLLFLETLVEASHNPFFTNVFKLLQASIYSVFPNVFNAMNSQINKALSEAQRLPTYYQKTAIPLPQVQGDAPSVRNFRLALRVKAMADYAFEQSKAFKPAVLPIVGEEPSYISQEMERLLTFFDNTLNINIERLNRLQDRPLNHQEVDELARLAVIAQRKMQLLSKSVDTSLAARYIKALHQYKYLMDKKW